MLNPTTPIHQAWAILLVVVIGCSSPFIALASDDEVLNSFIGEPKLELVKVYDEGRFPNLIVAKDGSLLAFWNGVVVRKSSDGGATWGDTIKVADGFMGGGVTLDEASGDILAFIESGHPPADVYIYRSQDHGLSWQQQETVIEPDESGNSPSMHMNEHGTTLQFGPHRGRLIRPTRFYAGKNDRSQWPEHFTNAIYSDDGGKSWKTSKPFLAKGTGEACIVELADGRLYYNSRRHWAPEGVNPLRRWHAYSDDGGVTWSEATICETLPDGSQHRSYGLMGGLTRLPLKDKDVLLFSNIESNDGRKNGVVWASFDGGTSWPIKRVIYKGKFAYSSMNVGRTESPSDGWIYVFFEGGEAAGTVARFNLSWLLQGTLTGDGQIPDWVGSTN